MVAALGPYDEYTIGQGTFRLLVTDVYEKRCAVTGEKVLPVLQAAHIQLVTEGGTHRIDNGLLLRSDGSWRRTSEGKSARPGPDHFLPTAEATDCRLNVLEVVG